MKRNALFSIFLLLTLTTLAQFEHSRVYSTFDNLDLPNSDTFNNGADGAGRFTHYGRLFNNSYDDTWGSWSGWALSNMQDDTTAGFGNQYSAITGHGLSHTDNYMVSTGDGAYIKFDQPTNIKGAYFTNSTYAALDMKNGSGFSKKFGGESGDDEDYFRVEVKSYLEGSEVASTKFYLADFRFEDNSKDFILDDWRYIHLTNNIESLDIDSMVFSYESSDEGEFGVNTPKYFCMDDFNSFEPSTFTTSAKATIDNDTFYNGSDLAGGFYSKNLFFNSSFNTEWNSWSGWSISSKLDRETPGFQNQYSCIGTGRDNFYLSGGQFNEIRGQYFSKTSNVLHKTIAPSTLLEFYITNSTYAALDMRDGSGFSKKFGGESGDDPDFFRLLVSYVDAQNIVLKTDTVYLADYRFEDNSLDYILTSWVKIKTYDDDDVNFHKIKFELQSSDVGQFGMNTPAYFCLDYNFRVVNVNEFEFNTEINLYPNPAINMVTLDAEIQMQEITIYNIQGTELMNEQVSGTTTNLDISVLPSGLYFAEIQTQKGSLTKRFIKE
jgi:hypothetical protein